MTSKELVAASTIPMVLSILSRGKNYGYLIIKTVKEVSDGNLDWSEAMLYPVLHRMERDGLIRSEWVIEGRKRKYYSITDLGKSKLHEKKQEWIEMNLVLTKLWLLQS